MKTRRTDMHKQEGIEADQYDKEHHLLLTCMICERELSAQKLVNELERLSSRKK